MYLREWSVKTRTMGIVKTRTMGIVKTRTMGIVKTRTMGIVKTRTMEIRNHGDYLLKLFFKNSIAFFANIFSIMSSALNPNISLFISGMDML